MSLEIFSQLLSENSEIIFEEVQKLVLDKTYRLKFPVNIFIPFGLLKSIPAEIKAIRHDQNFVLF
jgi:hypothetical protein